MMTRKIIRTYSELITLPTFEERFRYLKLGGKVGEDTFGFDRYLNQVFYRSAKWKEIRDYVIIRDNGCDLGMEGHESHQRILVHHMNPITEEDILVGSDKVYNPEFLISVSHRTHQAIHYGDKSLLPKDPVMRKAGDTKLWK